ncbi:MAG TPA: FAD-binding oxidoreductase [Candidatus Binataceae bacterium]|nr:FAD-binding oxidoreductase [Candidatus Binataceae bacterium]
MAELSTIEIAKRVAEALGADRVREPAGLEARAARVIAEPANVDEVGELVRFCEAEKIALAPVGAARTLAEIRRAPAALGVSLGRIARIVAYEPDDMTAVAEAGITVAELNRVMAPSRQRLPVDPQNPALATIGALIAAHHAGPLRLSEGTVRDLVIGIDYVGHGGIVVRGGGRVVKNVAGYDLMKVMGGSFGTLGIITQAAFKVRPIPENYTLALAPYARIGDAFEGARELIEALPLAHLEILSPALAAPLDAPGRLLLAAGFSGNRAECDYQRAKISEKAGAAVIFRDGDGAIAAYERLRDFDLPRVALAAQVAVPPAELARFLSACGAIEFRAHAGSGVAQVFVAGELASDAGRDALARWRESARAARGNVRVLRAAPALRDSLAFFDTPGAGALKLMRRMKQAFDPAGVFNPGCFVGGL